MDYTELIRNYGYWAVTLGTFVDHSGIPAFIIAGGIFCASGTLDVAPAAAASLIGLELSDLALLLIGRYFGKNKHVDYPKIGFASLFIRLLGYARRITGKLGPEMYLFSKWAPAVGKYAPLISGYEGRSVTGSMLLYLPGNMIYAACFLTAGLLFGEFLLAHKKAAAVLLLAFILIYCIFRIFAPRSGKLGFSPDHNKEKTG